jgi:hypothetical protein
MTLPSSQYEARHGGAVPDSDLLAREHFKSEDFLWRCQSLSSILIISPHLNHDIASNILVFFFFLLFCLLSDKNFQNRKKNLIKEKKWGKMKGIHCKIYKLFVFQIGKFYSNSFPQM